MSSDAPWTIGRLLNWTKEFLEGRDAESPRLDAEVLLAHARGCKRIELYTTFDDVAPQELRDAYRELVKRRAAGTPVAYLVGRREFYSLEFEVTPDVLIPRPETELLVVALTDHAKDSGREADPLKVVDIGTGSGVLAVCAAKTLPQARVTAVDISPAALAVAQRNAERHGVADRIAFLESDLFANVPEGQQFDAIVSNPPYVTTDEWEGLAPDVRDHEPRLALDGGDDGAEVIRRLIDTAPDRLTPGGLLLIEIGPAIAPLVESLLDAAPLDRLETVNDLEGRARVARAQKEAP